MNNLTNSNSFIAKSPLTGYTPSSPAELVVKRLHEKLGRFTNFLAHLEFKQAAFYMNPEYELPKTRLTFWDNVSSPFLLLVSCERIYSEQEYAESQADRLCQMYNQVFRDLGQLMHLIAKTSSIDEQDDEYIIGTPTHQSDESKPDMFETKDMDVLHLLNGLQLYCKFRCEMVKCYSDIASWSLMLEKWISRLESPTEGHAVERDYNYFDFLQQARALESLMQSVETELKKHQQYSLLKRNITCEFKCLISAFQSQDALNFCRFSDTVSLLLKFKDCLNNWSSLGQKEEKKENSKWPNFPVRNKIEESPAYKLLRAMYQSMIDKMPLYFQRLAQRTSTGGYTFLNQVERNAQMNYSDLIRDFLEQEDLKASRSAGAVLFVVKEHSKDTSHLEFPEDDTQMPSLNELPEINWIPIFSCASTWHDQYKLRKMSDKDAWELQKIGKITGGEVGWGNDPSYSIQNAFKDAFKRTQRAQSQSYHFPSMPSTSHRKRCSSDQNIRSPFGSDFQRSRGRFLSLEIERETPWIFNHWHSIVEALNAIPDDPPPSLYTPSSNGQLKFHVAKITQVIFMITLLKEKKKKISDKVIVDFSVSLLSHLSHRCTLSEWLASVRK